MLEGVTFVENGHVDVDELNALYRLIGWDRHGRRTPAETAQMLRASHYYISAHLDGRLVGFARVCGDPYVVQLLDVITHPSVRRRGIATRCMQGVAAHVDGARYVSVTCTAAPALHEFYARFGFRPAADATLQRR
ncbi:MAG: GNAT family N-acetyltransferase [Myxococcales bacterium]|nr:GNAT family N-acetyltransferase [Myxococcales bacterium]